MGLDLAAVGGGGSPGGGPRRPRRRCAPPPGRRRRAPRHRTGTRSTAPGGRVGPGGDEQPRVGAAEGLGGGVRVAEQHQVDPAAGRRPPAAAAAAAGVSSWASSTTTSRSPARSRSSASGSASRWSAAAPRIQAGSKAPGADSAVTSSYSRSTCGGGHPLGPVVLAPQPGEVVGVEAAARRPASAGRAARRGSVRVGSARRTDSGHGGAGDSPAAWPASSSPRMTSCSGPLSSRGAGSPTRAAASRRMPKPRHWWVRASGLVVVPPSRAVTASRSRAAASRVGASSRHCVGARPRPPRPAGPRPRRPRSSGPCRPAEHPQHRAAVLERPPAGSRRAPGQRLHRWRGDEGRAPRDSTTPLRQPLHRTRPCPRVGCSGGRRGSHLSTQLELTRARATGRLASVGREPPARSRRPRPRCRRSTFTASTPRSRSRSTASPSAPPSCSRRRPARPEPSPGTAAPPRGPAPIGSHSPPGIATIARSPSSRTSSSTRTLPVELAGPDQLVQPGRRRSSVGRAAPDALPPPSPGTASGTPVAQPSGRVASAPEPQTGHPGSAATVRASQVWRSASCTSSRPTSGSPMPATSLIASVDWTDPMPAHRAPSTPPSAHDGTASGRRRVREDAAVARALPAHHTDTWPSKR